MFSVGAGGSFKKDCYFSSLVKLHLGMVAASSLLQRKALFDGGQAAVVFLLSIAIQKEVLETQGIKYESKQNSLVETVGSDPWSTCVQTN